MNGMSPQLQNEIKQYQQVQQQLQAVTSQHMQLGSQQKEMKKTVEELGKAKDDVYKSVGAVLIKVSDKDALKSDMEESLEMLDIRVRGLEKQEKDLRERFTSLQENINKAMGNVTPGN